MKYGVFDGGRPATDRLWNGKNPNSVWKNHLFDTFDEALQYAIDWLGDYAPSKDTIQLNHPYDYSGHGDMIEVREIEIAKTP